MQLRDTSKGYRVTLRELAAELGGNVDPLSRVDVATVGPDWRGMPSVPVAVAAEAVRSHREGVQKHEARQAAFEGWHADRDARRAQVVSEEADRAYRAHARVHPGARTYESIIAGQPAGRLIGERPNPENAAYAREQAEEAGRKFDQRNPALALAEWLKTPDGKDFA
jgi:hypothetical protein